ncbi:hypothetical protein RclHR1_17280002 [Rhizophagus clarus]|uniref:Uncharacterized protein n=1 Tax=Rhizophagus clarus TaxID=94130 RepID=A0A2Z6QYJ1_9GLOM|nr:hypothetical protein RclHR1_17280002 [Rhizophagus clarus]
MEPKKKESECKLNVKKQDDSQFNNKDDTEKCEYNLFDDYNVLLEEEKDDILSDDNDALSEDDNILSLISPDTLDKKSFKKKQIIKLDQIKNKNLQKHPIVNKVIIHDKVECKCGKIIKLHQVYNPQNLEIHNKTGHYLLTKGVYPLTNYFTITTKLENSCVRLREEKHVKYLQRIGRVIHYGGAPCVEVLEKELFPRKFEKTFSWKRLMSKEAVQLENELTTRAKWRNDFSAGCIRNMESEKGHQGIFKNKKVFEGLCKIMVKIAGRKERNKGNQNLKYSENFTNFTIILASFGTREYEIFKQNLAGQMLRNIRLHHAQSGESISNTDICYENML